MRCARDRPIFIHQCIPLWLCFYFFIYFLVGSYTRWISNFPINRLVKHDTNVAGVDAWGSSNEADEHGRPARGNSFASKSQLELCTIETAHELPTMLYWYSSTIFPRRKDFNLFLVKWNRPSQPPPLPPPTHKIDCKLYHLFLENFHFGWHCTEKSSNALLFLFEAQSNVYWTCNCYLCSRLRSLEKLFKFFSFFDILQRSTRVSLSSSSHKIFTYSFSKLLT